MKTLVSLFTFSWLVVVGKEDIDYSCVRFIVDKSTLTSPMSNLWWWWK